MILNLWKQVNTAFTSWTFHFDPYHVIKLDNLVLCSFTIENPTYEIDALSLRDIYQAKQFLTKLTIMFYHRI